jgi:hydroxymethylbilane synthase
MMGENKLIIGSRGSRLALAQAEGVKQQLVQAHPDVIVDIKIIKTQGDLFTSSPLYQLGGKGLFTKEIEEALLRHEVDLAVHSLKDLPTQLPEGLSLGAVSQREDPRDAFISNHFSRLEDLPSGARVGTSSLRRQSQLLALWPDLNILDLRGNLDTRLRKLDENQYDAIILACAGLVRLRMTDRIRQAIPVEVICPAVSQAALGIEIRSRDAATRELIQCIHDPETEMVVLAERSLLMNLGGGCHVPIAGHAWMEEGQLNLRGVVASPDGKRVLLESGQSPPKQAERLGAELAQRLLDAGGKKLLEGSGSLSEGSRQ